MGKILAALGIVVFYTSCVKTPIVGSAQTQTPTISGGAIVAANQCEGVSGELEMQVLVGPTDAVGMEPIAVGHIPFSVVTYGAVQGGGVIAYQDVLEEEWGTYTVSFDMEAMLSGNFGGEVQDDVLYMMTVTSGEQLVEVRSEGFQGDYPWEGTHEFDPTFTIKEGAADTGEGWTFVLHLNE